MRSRRIVSRATRSTRASMRIAASAILLLLVGVAFDERLEPVEADVPELFPLPQPAFGFFERAGFDPDKVGSAALAPLNQPRVFEHFHMLRRAGEAHRERFGELADRFLAEREVCQNSAP